MCIHRYLESMEMIIRIPYKANVLMLGSGRMIVGMKIEEGQLITSFSSDNERVGGRSIKSVDYFWMACQCVLLSRTYPKLGVLSL